MGCVTLQMGTFALLVSKKNTEIRFGEKYSIFKYSMSCQVVLKWGQIKIF